MASAPWPTQRTARRMPLTLRKRRRYSRNGLPRMGAMGLGRSPTTDRSRVPRPPARIMAGNPTSPSSRDSQGAFHQLHQHVADGDVRFLDMLGGFAGDADRHVPQLARGPSRLAGENNRLELAFARPPK